MSKQITNHCNLCVGTRSLCNINQIFFFLLCKTNVIVLTNKKHMKYRQQESEHCFLEVQWLQSSIEANRGRSLTPCHCLLRHLHIVELVSAVVKYWVRSGFSFISPTLVCQVVTQSQKWFMVHSNCWTLWHWSNFFLLYLTMYQELHSISCKGQSFWIWQGGQSEARFYYLELIIILDFCSQFVLWVWLDTKVPEETSSPRPMQ